MGLALRQSALPAPEIRYIIPLLSLANMLYRHFYLYAVRAKVVRIFCIAAKFRIGLISINYSYEL